MSGTATPHCIHSLKRYTAEVSAIGYTLIHNDSILFHVFPARLTNSWEADKIMMESWNSWQPQLYH